MTVADQHQPAIASDTAPILKVDGLKTYFFTRQGTVKAVDGVSFVRQPQ